MNHYRCNPTIRTNIRTTNWKMSDFLQYGWVQFRNAVSYSGHKVPPNCETACAWSLAGVIERCFCRNEPLKLRIMNAIKQRINISLDEWNDKENRRKEEVVKLIKEVEIELGL